MWSRCADMRGLVRIFLCSLFLSNNKYFSSPKLVLKQCSYIICHLPVFSFVFSTVLHKTGILFLYKRLNLKLVVVARSEIPLIFWSKKFMDPYQEGMFDCNRDLESKDASLSNGKEDPMFSSLYQYLILDLIASKWRGNLPNSDKTAKFLFFFYSHQV